MHSATHQPSLRQREIIDSGLVAVLPRLDVTPLAGKHIFITGGTGFFGLWLLSALAVLNRQGVPLRATVLSRDPALFLAQQPHWKDHGWLSFVRGNVRDFEFPDLRADLLIHAATDTSSAAQANPLAIFDDSVLGTRRVLDFAVKAGAGRVLLASSGAVYGAPPPGVTHIPEDAPYACLPEAANSAYGEGKRAMELLGALYQRQYGIEAVIARCFAFVGPGLPLDGHFAIGNFISDALYADTVCVKGDGTPMRSYLYGADLAVWLLSLLGRGRPGYPYNVGSEQAISIAELATLVQQTLAPGKACRVQAAPTLHSEPRRYYVPSTGRGRSSMQLDAWTPLRQAIQWTGDFYKMYDTRGTKPEALDTL